MIETHAFGNFIPPNSKFLVLGSFTAKQANIKNLQYNQAYDWFYSNGRNQFWSLIEITYNVKLPDKLSKQRLLSELGIAMADIILQCERREGTNLDNNLINCSYNLEVLKEMLVRNKLETIFFTSRYVEKIYRRLFKALLQEHPDVTLITLPSPSPRYALMTKEQKIAKYKELLPKLDTKRMLSSSAFFVKK
jgi:hypoxanthine-DNA glycosylase